ncbi:MAG: hypothetical protein MI725_14305 [Pirellulales bacterium]|nr:hypothetical protein [Pirellulales bacterium]
MLQSDLPRRFNPSILLTAASIFVLVISSLSSTVLAVPYASGISQSGTIVTYVLNEDADSITVKRTGDTDLIISDPNDLKKGTHTFDVGGLASAWDIEVSKNTVAGWTQVNDPTTEATFQYFSPRGVTVNKDPNSPYFGNIYVSNALLGSTGDPNGVGRTDMGNGIYAVTADGSDVYGIGDVGRTGGLFFEFSDVHTNTPNKISVAPDGTVYIGGWSDGAPGVWRAPGNLADSFSGGSDWPSILDNSSCSATGLCSNHGNNFSVYIEGTGSGTTLYTMDEDYPNEPGFFGAERGDILKYDIGTATDYTGLPSVVVDDGHDPNGDGGVSGKIIGNPSDFVRDEDGSWWIAQWRSDDSFAFPTLSHWADDPNATGPLWQSGKENRVPGDVDWDTDIDGFDFLTIQQNLGKTGQTAFQGDTDGDGDVDPNDLAIWEAAYPKQPQQGQLVLQGVHGTLDIHNDLDLIVLGTRFGNGIYIVDISDPNNPVLQEHISHAGSTINDVAFDIAGNAYIASRSSETLRIYSPGGNFLATTGSDGTFSLTEVGAITTVPEPSTLVTWLTFSLLGLLGYRPCRQPARACVWRI